MINRWMFLGLGLSSLVSMPASASPQVGEIQQKLQQLKSQYEQRIGALEAQLQQLQSNEQQTVQQLQKVNKELQQAKQGASDAASSGFNPQISVILDGRLASFGNDPEAYELPGFALGGEAGIGEEGFALGHTEIAFSANIDNRFFGQATVAIHEHEGETEVELEEAFIETIGLGNGLTVKFGRFFSGVGYLNEQHEHAWDFADAPLIYQGLFGNRLWDDGIQVSYVADTETFLQLGAEALSGRQFPAGGSHEAIGAWSLFANVGGDIGADHSWQLGLSHWRSNDIEGRTSGGHSHGGGADEIPSFDGDSEINAIDVVYKWVPAGDAQGRNLKLQFEYFERKEDGTVTLLNSSPLETTSYDGDQSGWYAQAVYQFKPQWKLGLRYDRLDADNSGSDEDVLEEAGLTDEGHTPERYSAMVEWNASEFSRIRFQYNRDRSYEDSDDQWFLQYTHSLGSHGAHQF
ncbi:MAG: hypothetical protein OQK12_13505 [Motiliproteus sp.]|nr:hypothetical protein [Motiliproteus sp.]MCW9053218.1 hypothetical protein [Motiliproteus sp.]